MKAVQALKEIKAIPKDLLLISDVAPFLGCDPQSIRVQAHEDPAKLGFPIIMIGTRIKIPKQPFINFMLGKVDKP